MAEAQEQELNEYGLLVKAGQKLVMELVGEANNLANCSLREEAALAIATEHRWPPSPFTLSALRTSAALLQFASLEALTNFTAELAVSISMEESGAPSRKRALHALEIEFLKEQETTFDPRSGKIRTRGAFSSTLDRLVIVPRLLGEVAGVEFEIDKSGQGWQSIQQLKDLRDQLTHPKIAGNVGYSPAHVNPRHLFTGGAGLFWYFTAVERLLMGVLVGPEAWIITTWMMLYQLRAAAGVPEADFDKVYPQPPAIAASVKAGTLTVNPL